MFARLLVPNDASVSTQRGCSHSLTVFCCRKLVQITITNPMNLVVVEVGA